MSGHGHVTPNANGLKARCGGPAICSECALELAAVKAKDSSAPAKDREAKYLEIIDEWKSFWMDQTQNSKQDYENYFRRAFGIDANMMYDLARRLAMAEKAEGT